MSPEQKFHAYVTTATVFTLYLVVTQLLPNIEDISENAVYTKLIISILSAFGVYNGLAKTFGILAREWSWLKKHLLGPNYLNGTWVGSFKNDWNEEKTTIEIFEQNISSLVIRGEAFNADGTVYAQWTSVAVSINSRDGFLAYTYTCDSIVDHSTFQGIGVFKFERKSSSKPPTYISGYSADLTDGRRTDNREKRIDEKLLERDEALEKAKEYIPM